MMRFGLAAFNAVVIASGFDRSHSARPRNSTWISFEWRMPLERLYLVAHLFQKQALSY
jgi:hypothetical protein